MSALFTDSFGGANANPIAGNWESLSGLGTGAGLQLTSNTIGPGNSGTDCASRVKTSAVTAPNNQYSQAVVSTVGDADGGPAIRMSATNDLIFTTYYDGSGHIYEVVGGGFGEKGSGAGGYSGSAVTYLDAVGTLITAKVNSSTICTGTATIASGQFGAFIFGTLRLDDFEGGDFSAGGSGAVPSLGLLGVGA